MNNKRRNEFAKAFDINEPYIVAAYDKIHRRYVYFGYEGDRLEILTERALFKLLGVVSGETDIVTMDARSSMVSDIMHMSRCVFGYCDFKYSDYQELDQEDELEIIYELQVEGVE